VKLVPVGDTLPEGFAALRDAARAEGFRFLDRLAEEFAAGTERFVPPARLYLVEAESVVGCGGITRDPYVAGALRMRRFYVCPAARGRGVARALAEAVLAEVPPGTTVLLNAGVAGAASFWEQLGFSPETAERHTHRWRQA
jgi:GNAT superfamily N-acetyltransferase